MREKIFDARAIAQFNRLFRSAEEFFQSAEIENFNQHQISQVILPESGVDSANEVKHERVFELIGGYGQTAIFPGIKNEDFGDGSNGIGG